jgi:hypothetical protein
MKIRCTTRFDITATGVTGHCKPSRLPFTDASGQTITSEADWNRARNQQRNLETITQLLSLRTQIDNVTTPVFTDNQWSFEFEVESDTIFAQADDPLGTLKEDCYGVPMLLSTDAALGADNIWFEPINIL